MIYIINGLFGENMTTENIITFTEAAASKINEVLKEQGNEESYLRITLTMGENGGAGYEFGLEDKASGSDTIIESNGVKAIIDSGSTPLITGASIDYVEGMQRSGFVISNPNMPSGEGCACGGGGCGCGR
ncbi:MAG: iron-sulfur cluster assembly accessory protein [Chloroflexi bacterium]|nr:iron-sulfur cluster assembly accessory protein [Chloroflexota bacterium]|tara:strand:- start:8359 stop:8748 length:390 start_codon:yes stop_codon:yes gene_type:complete